MTREELLQKHETLCAEARGLMKLKNADYACNADPFRNFRTFGELGFIVRMSDKLARLHSYCERGELSVRDESVEDTLLDLINYSVLLAAYLQETRDARMDRHPHAAADTPDRSGLAAGLSRDQTSPITFLGGTFTVAPTPTPKVGNSSRS